MIIVTAFDHFRPFLTIFKSKISTVFEGRHPMHLRSNHDLNLWFSTVTLLWLIMRLLLSGIIEKRLSQKSFGGIQTFFRQIIKLKNHLNKRYLGDNGRKCWYLFWSRRPYFLINFNFWILTSLKNSFSFLVIFDQNSLFSSSKSDFGTNKTIFCYTTPVSVSTVNRPRMNSKILVFTT